MRWFILTAVFLVGCTSAPTINHCNDYRKITYFEIYPSGYSGPKEQVVCIVKQEVWK